METRKKILIATGIYPPDIGGPATYSKILYDKLPNKGFGVEVLSFGGVRYLPKVLRHVVYFFQVLIEGINSDIIFAQDPVSVGFPAVLASKVLGKKFILKIVGDYAWEQYSGKGGAKGIEEFQKGGFDPITELRRKIQKYTARNAEVILVPSKYLKKIVSDGWGVDEYKIRVVYNALEETEVSISKEEAIKELHLSGEVLVSAGRLVPWKGLDVLIEVVALLSKEKPGLNLVIIGDGPEKDTLEKKARNIGVSDRVLFTGALPKEKLMKYLVGGDLFVLNTGYEGFSHQLLEVMSVGMPVITTKIGGNPELVEDGKNGILVEYNNKEDLSKAIKTLFDDKNMTQKLADKARQKVKEFNQDKMISGLVRELTDI